MRLSAAGVGAAALLSVLPTGATGQTTTRTTRPTTTSTNSGRYDLRDFVRWIVDDFEPSVRLPGPAGHYARTRGDTELELYGTSDMACILYSIGRLRPTDRERAEWGDAFTAFQNADTGYLLEKEPTHPALHNTAFALGAMELLDIKPAHPLKFAADFADPRACLQKLDWENRVYSDSHKGAGFGAIYALSPELAKPEWFDAYFSKCDELFDARNGMMGVGKPAGGDSDQIGGTFHYQFIYEYFHRRMPYPQQRIDAVLGLQQADGYWHPKNHLWLTLDAIYMLTRTLRYCHHRPDEVRRAICRAMDSVMADVFHPDSRATAFGAKLGVHSLTAAISMAAEVQQFLGAEGVATDWPLRIVLDRRPFI